MVKWEYLEVQLSHSDISENSWSGHESCDGERKDIPVSRVREWFSSLELVPNHYGKKGWELIKMGSHGSSTGGGKWYLFKRQK